MFRSEALLDDLNKNKDGKHDAHQSVQTHDRAQEGEDNADQRDGCQQANDKAAYDVDQHIDDQRDNEGLYISGLKSGGKEFLRISILYISSMFL